MQAKVNEKLFVAWLALGAATAGLSSCSSQPKPTTQLAVKPDLNVDATWPWPNAKKVKFAKGFHHWTGKGTDGSSLDLLEFDFHENPRLSFAIYDQDQDDVTPFDNRVDYFPRGVGQVVGHLNKKEKVVAAWNGLFFGYDRGPGSPPQGWANHIGPVVLNGKPHFNVGRHRWTFGVKDGIFKAIFKPDKVRLSSDFDFAADGAQLLIKEGKSLRIQPFEESIGKKKIEDTPDAIGSIPIVDWMKTSRTSMAWSKDSRFLWVLLVVEADHETGSKLATKYGTNDPSGWTVADLQEFWKRKGVWGAINSDGGVVTQFALMNSNSSYEVKSSQQSSRSQKRTYSNLEQSPDGGSLLTFYVHQRLDKNLADKHPR